MGISYWLHIFWLTTLVLQAFLVAIMALKKRWKSFPLFSVYLTCALIGDLVEYSLSYSKNAYIAAYIVSETVSIGLALAVIYEIFRQLFSSHKALTRLAWLTFRLVCVLLVLLGAVVIYSHGPVGARGIVAGVVVMEEASRVVEVGLIMFLFLFSSAFGLQWRQQIFGLVLGFGIYAAVRLAATSFVPQSFVTAGILNLSIMLSYSLTLVIWIGYMLVRERVIAVGELPKTAQLEHWNRAMMELINQ